MCSEPRRSPTPAFSTARAHLHADPLLPPTATLCERPSPFPQRPPASDSRFCPRHPIVLQLSRHVATRPGGQGSVPSAPDSPSSASLPPRRPRSPLLRSVFATLRAVRLPVLGRGYHVLIPHCPAEAQGTAGCFNRGHVAQPDIPVGLGTPHRAVPTNAGMGLACLWDPLRIPEHLKFLRSICQDRDSKSINIFSINVCENQSAVAIGLTERLG